MCGRGCYGAGGKPARPAELCTRGVSTSVHRGMDSRQSIRLLGSVPSRNIEPPLGAVTGEQRAHAQFPSLLPTLQVPPRRPAGLSTGPFRFSTFSFYFSSFTLLFPFRTRFFFFLLFLIFYLFFLLLQVLLFLLSANFAFFSKISRKLTRLFRI